MDKLILVLYVDVQNLSPKESEDLCNHIGKTLFRPEVIEKLDATTFIIPVNGGGTRLESINPKFIVDVDVYRDYRLKLDVLNENLDHFTTNISNGK